METGDVIIKKFLLMAERKGFRIFIEFDYCVHPMNSKRLTHTEVIRLLNKLKYSYGKYEFGMNLIKSVTEYHTNPEEKERTDKLRQELKEKIVNACIRMIDRTDSVTRIKGTNTIYVQNDERTMIINTQKHIFFNRRLGLNYLESLIPESKEKAYTTAFENAEAIVEGAFYRFLLERIDNQLSHLDKYPGQVILISPTLR